MQKMCDFGPEAGLATAANGFASTPRMGHAILGISVVLCEQGFAYVVFMENVDRHEKFYEMTDFRVLLYVNINRLLYVLANKYSNCIHINIIKNTQFDQRKSLIARIFYRITIR